MAGEHNARRTPKNKKVAGKKDAPLFRRLMWRVCAAAVIVICGVGAFVAVHYSYFTSLDVVSEGESRTLVIPHDTAWPEVIETLDSQGFIRHPRYFDLWARQRDLPRQVKAGTYTLKGPVSLEELREMLIQGGQTQDITVTIPEGFTIFHVADRLERLGVANRQDFLSAARSEALLREYDVPGESFEGYLFPDTYRIKQGSKAVDIVRRFHQRFIEVTTPLREAHAEQLEAHMELREMGFHELVILASLIERETNYDPERDLIARVFLNRIDKGIRLQTDPTCVYGETTYREIPHPRYCKDKLNRYSTYMIDGLPPGPISSPGKKSIEAAILPAQGEAARSYIFFVAKRDGSGSHHFTATYKEHKAAIRKFLK